MRECAEIETRIEFAVAHLGESGARDLMMQFHLQHGMAPDRGAEEFAHADETQVRSLCWSSF